MLRSNQSVALLAGIVFGAVCVVEAAVPTEDNVHALWTIIAMVLLILTPAITLRSPTRFFLGFVIYTLIKSPAYWITFPNLSIDESLTLPLVVWNTPGTYVGFPTSHQDWQWRVLFGVVEYWLYVDIVQVILRLHSFRPFGQMMRRITWRHLGAIPLSMIPILILYPISWRAKVTGTDLVPLYTQFEYYFSLTVFFMIFPLKHWLLHYLLDRADRRRPDTNEEAVTTVVAEEESS